MSEISLLPCPFCGGEAEIWRASADPKRPAWVGCMGRCAVLVSREYETTEEAIAAWNRRTPPASVSDGWQPTPDMIERVAKEICREQCAFMGEPPCWQVDGLSPDCDEPGCLALAEAAVSAFAEDTKRTPPAAVPDGWQPIETAPKDGTRFWGKVGDDAIAMLWHGKFNAFVSSWRCMQMAPGYQVTEHHHSPTIEYPTHWMPLPDAPAEARDD